MRASHLLLVVPDLEALIREAGDTPGVVATRIMKRGQENTLHSDFPQFSLLFPDQQSPAAAAVARCADLPDAGSGHWLRCDPVAMVPDLTRVWVGETRFDELPDEAFEALRQALSELFAGEDLEFHMPAPGRGYIRLTEAPDCHFHPPWRIAGEPLEHVLPEGREATRWRRLLNESQVLLHNVDELKALPQPVRPTSVWFWGAGVEKREAVGRHHRADGQASGAAPNIELRMPNGLIGEDPLIRGLSQWLDVPHHPESTQLDGGRWLVQWEADRKRSAAENLVALEEQWLKPAWSALRWGRVRKLTLASMKSYWGLGIPRVWLPW